MSVVSLTPGVNILTGALTIYTGESMTTVTHRDGYAFAYKCDGSVAISRMALVAIQAGGGSRIERLPFGQEDVKVIVELLSLGDIPMAFQAIAIRDGARQWGRLRVMLADKSHQFPGA